MSKIILFTESTEPKTNFWGAYKITDQNGKKWKLYKDRPEIAESPAQADSWGFQGIVITDTSDGLAVVCFGNSKTNYRNSTQAARDRFIKMILNNKKHHKNLKRKYPIYWVLSSLYGVSDKKIKKSLKK